MRNSSFIKWVHVSENLPPLEHLVLVAQSNGEVTTAMRAERRPLIRHPETKMYYVDFNSPKVIQWGQEENSFEYWYTIEDVIYWAEFPPHPDQQTDQGGIESLSQFGQVSQPPHARVSCQLSKCN